MKRDGYIIEEIVEQSNLEAAFDSVVSGKKRKSLNEGKWLIAHRESFLEIVRQEFLSGKLTFLPYHRKPTATELKNGGYKEKTIHEAGKVRILQVFCMAARIKINACMSVVDKHLHRRYIRTTSASIKNRGMHDLKQCIERDMKEDPTLRYWYKFDIRKFYDTVRQDFVMHALRRVFKDEKLLGIMEQFVYLMPDGISISIGQRSSQGEGNILLSINLDHYLKDRFRVKHFYRYCDDGLVGSSTKLYLWNVRDLTHERIESIGQTIKPNERVFPIEEGLDFLGYVIIPTYDENGKQQLHSRLRKRVKQSFCRKIAHVKSRKRRRELIGSFYGMAKHANCRNLMKKVLTKKEMIKLSDLGITYTPTDGKKRFHGDKVRLSAIVNQEIEIHDFERGVKTPHGADRYLVSFRDVRTQKWGKFFTVREEMKQILDKIAAKGDVWPVLVTVKAEPYENGGGFHYYFSND